MAVSLKPVTKEAMDLSSRQKLALAELLLESIGPGVEDEAAWAADGSAPLDLPRDNRYRQHPNRPRPMNNRREFHEDLKKNVKASLVAAGYSATYQSSQKWMASFNVSNHSSGGVSLFFNGVCEHCGESLPYRVINSQGAFGGRATFPRDCDATTAEDSLVREALPLLTNRLPSAAPHPTNVGVGLLSPQAAGELSQALQNRSESH